ncbi:hypothetical protein GJ496_002866 [Pomphorhynchus laevis]|nr:hypothetical protein GJ496_002866 [Pomphorhynchus laevis]
MVSTKMQLILFTIFFVECVSKSSYNKVHITQKGTGVPCDIERTNISMQAGEITAESNFFGICNVNVVSERESYDRTVFFLEEYLSSVETVKLKDSDGQIFWIMTHSTVPYSCFVVGKQSNIEYSKIESSVNSKLALKITTMKCINSNSACKSKCSLKQCKFYFSDKICEDACIPDEFHCDNTRHCPFNEDEKCGRSINIAALVLFLMGFISTIASAAFILLRMYMFDNEAAWITHYDHFTGDVANTLI